MHNLQLFTTFMAWKGLFQHLEGLAMDDYHEFKRAHDIQIEEWQLYWFHNYVSITRGIVAPSGSTTTLGISLVSGIGAIGNGGIIEGGGAWASTNMRGPLVTFHLVMEFFVSYDKITKGLKLKSYRVCKISNVNPMRACEKLMHGCIG
jgi:hypothetical protein